MPSTVRVTSSSKALWTVLADPPAFHTTRLCTVVQGIVLFECFRDGAQPYKGMKNAEVMREVPKGYRLPAPPGATEAVYAIMQRCWAEDAKQR
jgi:hypothetical protein